VYKNCVDYMMKIEMVMIQTIMVTIQIGVACNTKQGNSGHNMVINPNKNFLLLPNMGS
jgi:hypothetical protein